MFPTMLPKDGALRLYMFSSFWLLGVESRDFSQAEKERHNYHGMCDLFVYSYLKVPWYFNDKTIYIFWNPYSKKTKLFYLADKNCCRIFQECYLNSDKKNSAIDL